MYPGKPARLGEAVTACNIGDIGRIPVAVVECPPHRVQPAQQYLSGGANGQKPDAGRPQGSLADANPLTQLGHVLQPCKMLFSIPLRT